MRINYEKLADKMGQVAPSIGADDVYIDFIKILSSCLSWGTNKDLYNNTCKKYSGKELHNISLLIIEIFNIYNYALKNDTYADPLGNIYEILASRHKRSKLGQYFTPEPICDLMAEITKMNWEDNFMEPCAGSGRMILAAHKIAKGGNFVAYDIDYICAHMTAINMAIHGIKGAVFCKNYLIQDEKPSFEMYVNQNYWKNNIPCIYYKGSD